jgi:hypothetical protein
VWCVLRSCGRQADSPWPWSFVVSLKHLWISEFTLNSSAHHCPIQDRRGSLLESDRQ